MQPTGHGLDIATVAELQWTVTTHAWNHKRAKTTLKVSISTRCHRRISIVDSLCLVHSRKAVELGMAAESESTFNECQWNKFGVQQNWFVYTLQKTQIWFWCFCSIFLLVYLILFIIASFLLCACVCFPDQWMNNENLVILSASERWKYCSESDANLCICLFIYFLCFSKLFVVVFPE